MPTLRLTKSAVDRLGTVAKPTYHYDTDLKGFFLRVMPTGAAAWGVEYRVGSGRVAEKKRLTIAPRGRLTPDEARRAARQHLANVALGVDPAAEKAARLREMTVAALLNVYEAEGCYVQRGARQGEPMKATTKRYTMARLRHHVLPLLGAKKLSAIGVGDLERFYRDVAAGKTACDRKEGHRRRIIVTGGEGAARKVFRDLSAVLSFAENRGYVERNWCRVAAVRKTDNVKDRFLSSDEVVRLADAIRVVVEEGANRKAAEIILLWLLTGCRRDEIAGLRWSEVRFGDGASALLLSDTKTGKSWRPCPPAAEAVLRSIEPVRGSLFVFPAERGSGFYSGTRTVWENAVRIAELEDVTPHTLRHTVGSHAASGGESLLLVGAILGHANPRSTARYAHVQRDPVQEAATRATSAFLPLAEQYVQEKAAAHIPDHQPRFPPMSRG